MESTNRLKQRLSRVFRPSTLLRTTCSSTTSATGSIFASSSAANTSSRRSLSAAATTESVSPSTALDRSLPFPSSSRFLSLDCTSACRPTKASDPIDVVPYVATSNVAEKGNERTLTQPGDSHATEEKGEAKKNSRRTNKKKKGKPLLSNNAYGFTSSSDSEFFSDGDGRNEKDTDAFFSSRSFSSDSSEFYSRPSRRKTHKKTNRKQSKPPPPRRKRNNNNNNNKGVPVMKRSNDPYIDFRSSMVEMIVERQIFGARDLERLLHSYLALNSPHHHAAILRAFADISQVLYGH